MIGCFLAEDFWDGLDPGHAASGAQDFAGLRASREAIGDFWIGRGLLQLLGAHGGFGLTLRKPTEAARPRDI